MQTGWRMASGLSLAQRGLLTRPVQYPRCCILLLLSAGCGATPGGAEFDRVNLLRSQAGLPMLQQDSRLAQAAALHARYLDRHRDPAQSGQGLSAHTQRPGDEGFSGEDPADRALAAGYPHREVLENVSMGYRDADSAIEGLMSAIYHRLTFLDLEADQLGVAVGERSRVFLLGRSDVAQLCDAPPPEALYRTPVDCLGEPMTGAHYDELCDGLPPEAIYRASHPVACPNGELLDAAYMAGVCERPPPSARFRGHGLYYKPCDNGIRIDAKWFEGLCEGRPEGAVYADSGTYYEICEDAFRVRAEWLEAHCAALPAGASYTDSGRYRLPCSSATEVRVEYLDALDAASRRAAPDVVLWPPEGTSDIPPAFFLEQPDPLPDLPLSGYPVSIQFNPEFAPQVTLEAFDLFLHEGASLTPVDATRLLDRDSDPNQLLSAHEFALFPLERLVWGGNYLAQVVARVDGIRHQFAWSFTTQGVGTPVLTAAAAQQRFAVRSGVEYLLYVPPQTQRPHTVLTTRTEHLRGNQLILEVVDPNTLRLRVEARLCDRIRLSFDGGRVVELVPDGCAGSGRP
jgi:hypothetical protein